MFGSYEHDYDYSCKNCGKGYYAEVGFGGGVCKGCGKCVDSDPHAKPYEIPTDLRFPEALSNMKFGGICKRSFWKNYIKLIDDSHILEIGFYEIKSSTKDSKGKITNKLEKYELTTEDILAEDWTTDWQDI